nr:immunoglobulin heavy chain junction region [Macaca mulatta]MOY25826.1 immunoglobulin heavy chain junction region [Macaca mulatta]MOY29700.1 immunoglobulin heavy chain junction region [Macaca mulatta]
CARRAENFDYW